MTDFIPPHKKISRPIVSDEDFKAVNHDRIHMGELMKKYSYCVGIAHSQIEGKDPLRFFMTRDGYVYVNPEIIEHGRQTVESKEGCMTYPGMPDVTKARYRLVTIRYQNFDGGEWHEQLLRGLPAIIAQHEIDHLNGIYCYDV